MTPKSFALLLLWTFKASVTLGYSASDPSNTTASWSRHPFIGSGPRQEHSVSVVDKDIYLIGGVTPYTFTTVDRVEFYSVPSGTWHVACPLPRVVNHANSAGVDGNIYVLDGLSGGTEWLPFNNSYVYTPNNDSWAAITPLPPHSARGASAVGVYKSTIYLAGGTTIQQTQPPNFQDSVTTVSAYNTVSRQWDASLRSLPAPRQHVAGVVVNSTFYVIGGRENGTDLIRNTVFALDLDSPASWTELAPMPTAPSGLVCSAIDNWIYCFGGEGDPDNEYGVFDETEAYNVQTDTWLRLPPMQVPRHGMSAATVDGRIYIPGGGVIAGGAPVGMLNSFSP